MMEELDDIELSDTGMRIEHFRKVYFLGIGGIGMSAIARWCKANGKDVAGYDRTATTLTRRLEEEGIAVTYEDSASAIPKAFTSDTLVVVTPAVPQDAAQLQYFRQSGLTMLKRSEVLGLITEDYLTVAVAGTHGKTTTSTMIAHVLHHAGEECTAFLGGIRTTPNSNFLLAENDLEQIVVVEADEYDRSFLRLHPDIAVITSVEADHLDIYGEANALTESFIEFAQKIPKEGSLIVQQKVAPLFSYDFSYSTSEGDYIITDVRKEEGVVLFDAKTPGGMIRDIQLHQPGIHNLENALAAIAVAQQLDVPKKKIKEAFATYLGVKRRFEYIIKTDDFVYIDDYAHHPTEIEMFLRSVKELYPGRKVTAVFQPHLYSRTRDFAEGFSQSLSIADEVILLDIYPAREKPIEGVSSEMLLKEITTEKALSTKEALLDNLKSRQLDVLVTVGAGDIDTLVSQIKDWKDA